MAKIFLPKSIRENEEVKKEFTPTPTNWSKLKDKKTFLASHPKTCSVCGKSFVCKTLMAFQRQVYCSRECAKTVKYRAHKVLCETCGANLSNAPPAIKLNHFCNSEICYKAYLEKLRKEHSEE